MITRNRSELETSELRRKALTIAEAAICHVLPPNLMCVSVAYSPALRTLQVIGNAYDLSMGRVFVAGGGKASGLMAETLERILGAQNITDGVVNCNSAGYATRKIRIKEAGHPIPDERGWQGVEEMLELKQKYHIGEGDFILCLISGGGSALLPCPVPGISLGDKQRVTTLLIECGAEIGEINAVRKHISKVKGGRMGESFAPARVISLIISDVVGNSFDVIASGPTYPDSSTFVDAYGVLEKYDLLMKVPASIVAYLNMGLREEVSETPKILSNCENHIIGDNRLALNAAAAKARDMGLKPFIITSQQKGDTGVMANLRANEIISGMYRNYNVILIGGETTVRLPEGHGRGGRNQHYTAASIISMEKYSTDRVLISLGTDGSDFLPDIAGAVVDSNSLSIARKKGIDPASYLARYDSFGLLDQLGNSLVRTGNTGTNVGDVIIYLTG
jgi:glycerate-2-kinase